MKIKRIQLMAALMIFIAVPGRGQEEAGPDIESLIAKYYRFDIDERAALALTDCMKNEKVLVAAEKMRMRGFSKVMFVRACIDLKTMDMPLVRTVDGDEKSLINEVATFRVLGLTSGDFKRMIDWNYSLEEYYYYYGTSKPMIIGGWTVFGVTAPFTLAAAVYGVLALTACYVLEEGQSNYACDSGLLGPAVAGAIAISLGGPITGAAIAARGHSVRSAGPTKGELGDAPLFDIEHFQFYSPKNPYRVAGGEVPADEGIFLPEKGFARRPIPEIILTLTSFKINF